jgi:hypothetical protein
MVPPAVRYTVTANLVGCDTVEDHSVCAGVVTMVGPVLFWYGQTPYWLKIAAGDSVTTGPELEVIVGITITQIPCPFVQTV